MAKKHQSDYASEPAAPLLGNQETTTESTIPNGAPKPARTKRKAPVTQQEVFDDETRIVRLLLRRIAGLPNEKSRERVLNRVYELKDFPLVDHSQKE